MNLKPVYSVTEIARMMGLSVYQAHRRLKKAGVVVGRGRGAKIDVPLTALRNAFPAIWESIVLVQQLAA